MKRKVGLNGAAGLGEQAVHWERSTAFSGSSRMRPVNAGREGSAGAGVGDEDDGGTAFAGEDERWRDR